MKELALHKSFTLIEPGPVTLITTSDEGKNNIMALSWHIVLDFSGRFAIMTGSWNYSFNALMKNRECVINIPGLNLLDKVVGIGTTTGSEVDKFKEFSLTPLKADTVNPPLIKECIAAIECHVVDHIKTYDMIVLEAVKAWVKTDYKKEQTLHYRGDGTFITDGGRFNCRKEMESKLAPGV